MNRVAAAVVALVLQGCVYAPRTVSVYDPDCQIVTRHMVLDGQQVAAIAHCHNEGCLTLLVAMGAVSAVTAVVSGSVVVVGNVVYWFEKHTQCKPVPQDQLTVPLPASAR